MRSSDNGCAERDRALVAAALAGAPDAVERFLEQISGTVWAGCRALSGYEGEARDKFLETIAWLRASALAPFREYDGRSSLKTFAALVVRDFHCRKIVGLFERDAAKAWPMLQDFLDADIRRLIRRRVPTPESDETRRDLYQSVCLALVEQDYRRIRAWRGSGSFSGFVLRCVDNILRDEIRTSIAPRRRLPVGIDRLGNLERELFRLVYWEQVPERAELLAQHLRTRIKRDVQRDEIESALARVRQFGVTSKTRADSGSLTEPLEPSPEDIHIEAGAGEQLLAAVHALTQAVGSLPEDERRYLSLVLMDNPPPPRELASIMGRPVQEIYTLKQRVLRRLHRIISEDSAVKDWLSSV
jgi:RNA polymerase primary sigma factor